MPTKYVRTGRPPGRPRKDLSRPPRDQSNAALALQAKLKEIEIESGVQLAPLELPPVDLTGVGNDPEKLMKAAVAQMMAGLHTQLPIALQRIAIRRPDIVISFYRDMAEYLMPKLSRLEQSGQVTHKHSHFVAVEPREIDPRKPPIELAPAADGTFQLPAPVK